MIYPDPTKFSSLNTCWKSKRLQNEAKTC